MISNQGWVGDIYFHPGSRDWYREPRGRWDVWRCKRGKHQRITRALHLGKVVCRCSCGGIELDYSGYWMETNQVGRRKGGESNGS